MAQALEASLKRLSTDYLDLYWLHMWDFMTPVEEVMRALDDLVRAGKILYIGISDTPAWVVAQANTLAELRGWSRFTALQAAYSLIDRGVERDLLPMARAFDLAVTAWGILEAGELTGKYNRESSEPKRSSQASSKSLAVAEVMELSQEIGYTPPKSPPTGSKARRRRDDPDPGRQDREADEGNLGCLDFELTTGQWQALDQLNPLSPDFHTISWLGTCEKPDLWRDVPSD